jgi:hypothetical protein
VLAGDDQAEVLVGKRDEGQAVGTGGGLARDSRGREAGPDRRGDLEVARRLCVITRQLGRLEAEAAALGVEKAARLRAGLAVDDPQAVPRDRVNPGDDRPELGPQHDALAPGGEPDHAVARWNRRVVLAAAVPGVHARRVHEALAREAERLSGAAGPPGERDRRVEQRERGREQRECRVAARHDERRAGRNNRADRDQPRLDGFPASPGAARGGTPGDGKATCREETEGSARIAAQRQRDEAVAHRGERYPLARAGYRSDACRRHRRGRLPGAE